MNMNGDSGWDGFDDDSVGDFEIGAEKPAEVPQACSIDNPDCEACQ